MLHDYVTPSFALAHSGLCVLLQVELLYQDPMICGEYQHDG